MWCSLETNRFFFTSTPHTEILKKKSNAERTGLSWPLRKSYQQEVGVNNRKKTFTYELGYYLFWWSSIPTTKFEEEIVTKQSFNWERCLRVSAILEVWIILGFSQEKRQLNVTNVTGVLCINQVSSDIPWHIHVQARRHLHVVSVISALVQLRFFRYIKEYTQERSLIHATSVTISASLIEGLAQGLTEYIQERGLLHAAIVARVLVTQVISGNIK